MSVEHEIVALELLTKSNQLTVQVRTLERMAPPGESVALRGHRYRKIKFLEAKADAYRKASELLFLLRDAGDDENIEMRLVESKS